MASILRKRWLHLLGCDVEAAKRQDVFWRGCFTLRLLLIYPISILRHAAGIESRVLQAPLFLLGAAFIWPWLGIYEILLAWDIRRLGDASARPVAIVTRIILTAFPGAILFKIPDSAYLPGLCLYALLTLIGALAGIYYLRGAMDSPTPVLLTPGNESRWPRLPGWEWTPRQDQGQGPEGGWIGGRESTPPPDFISRRWGHRFIPARYALTGYLLLRDQAQASGV
jgi:hypothetical protein